MDGDRFDAVARAAAVTACRRGALRALLAAALAVPLGSLVPRRAAARCVSAGGSCSRTTDCCGDAYCGAGGACCLPAGSACSADAACSSGFCRDGACGFRCRYVGERCRTGDQCCSGRCRDGTCRTHHTGTCAAGKDGCWDPEGAACGDRGECFCTVTTGGAPFCAGEYVCGADADYVCERDADCAAADTYFPPGSACIRVDTGPGGRCGGSGHCARAYGPTACAVPCAKFTPPLPSD